MLEKYSEKIIEALIRENKKLNEQNENLTREIVGFKLGYGSTNNKELQEENEKIKNLAKEYRNESEHYAHTIIDQNKEIQKLKKEIEEIKFSGQKFCYLDELVRINKESLKEKTELKFKIVALENIIENIRQIAGK